MPSITTENYLKAIYQLREKDPEIELVKFGDIARELNLTPGTITTMMKSLADRGLIEYHIRSGVKLTPQGYESASNVVRRHRLIELFLVQVLKMDWSEVHEDAEALEHAVSARVLDRIDAMMGHPDRDPHGDPIPGNIPVRTSTPLLYVHQIPCGVTHEVSRIDNQNPATLEQIAVLGLKPGTRIQREETSEPKAAVRINVGAESVLVPDSLASCIRVKVSS